MTDFPDFLAARLDEREAWLDDPRNWGWAPNTTEARRQHRIETAELQRLERADIEAKRRIITAWSKEETVRLQPAGRIPVIRHKAAVRAMQLWSVIMWLSEPFKDHPDYPGWN